MYVIMALSDFLKTERDLALLVFTKSELKIIERQVNGFSLTQSERNVLSRSVRPKLEFVRRCGVYEGEFRLKKAQDVKKIIADTVNVLKEIDGVRCVYLFGSVLTQSFDSRSDIDIAVEFRKISGKDAAIFFKNYNFQISERVDLSIFNLLPKNIRSQILKNGRKIYSNSGKN